MKYYSVSCIISGQSTVPADSDITVKKIFENLSNSELLSMLENIEINLAFQYIPEMFMRCSKCNSKLMELDFDLQKAFYLLIDNTKDIENQIDTAVFKENHKSTEYSNLNCGYKLTL